MAIFRKAVLATALIGSGLVSTTGLALADEGHSTDHGQSTTHEDTGGQQGLANVDGVQSTVPLNACNNDVPVNVLGVQVPIQDLGLGIPLLSPTDDGHNTAATAKSCGNPVAADND